MFGSKNSCFLIVYNSANGSISARSCLINLYPFLHTVRIKGNGEHWLIHDPLICYVAINEKNL